MSNPSPTEPSQPEAPTSTASTSAIAPPCAICTNHAAIYTCPRCSTRTCSLPCSTTHKSLGAGCSGIRNKAAYVPMNQYGYMALMDDYVFLEEVGRQVTGWGKEIVQGGYANGLGAAGKRGMNGRGRGRARGRGRGGVQGNAMRSKRDVLKMQLDFRDIEMDLLPAGMERRILNQSTWDFKNRTALLTLEFKFHPPPNPFAPSSQAPDPPFTLLTHRNSLETPLLSIIRTHVDERSKSKKEKHPPEWLHALVSPDHDDPDAFVPPVCVMPTRVDPLASLQNQSALLRPGHITRTGYYRLDPNQSLQNVLKHKQFVEYPVIEVWEEGAFSGTIVDDRGAVMRDEDEDRKPKRRKLGVREGRKAISGLLGGYGSDEEQEEGEAAEEQNVMNMLAGYAGSDDEAALDTEELAQDRLPRRTFMDYELGDEDAEGETDDEYEEPQHLATLLEQLRQAGALRDPTGDAQMVAGLGDDEVDWGDSDGGPDDES